jgi:hypothetical protein
MFVIPAVLYLFIRLEGCSVGLEISHGAGKQARTAQGYKKKKKKKVYSTQIFPFNIASSHILN